MSGYCGFSKSNNAICAENDNKFPLSRWTKAKIIEVLRENQINADFINAISKCSFEFLKTRILKCYEWHHTGSYFNCTDYYEVDLIDYDEPKQILAEYAQFKQKKVQAKEQKKEQKREFYKCKFLTWSGSRKHPKATEHEEIGEIIGNWFYSSFGKKSILANGFKIIEKIKM